MRIITILLLFVSLIVNAQSLKREKSFVCTDRIDYHTSDTIHISGVVLNEQNKTDIYSNYIYLDIIDDNDSIVAHQKLFNDNGRFNSAIEAQREWNEGLYFVRAYTKFMENFSPSTIPFVTVTINTKQTNNNSNALYCDFFPEGQNVAKGNVQRFGVYISNAQGLPISAAFDIINDEGTILDSSATTESGWQTISLIPTQQPLYLKTTYNGNSQSFMLPQPTDKENVRLMVGKKNISYDIYSLKENKSYRLYIYENSLGLLNIPKVSTHGKCLIDENIKGVVTLLLTDESGNIISESSAWHDCSDETQSDIDTTITRFLPIDTKAPLISTAEQQVYFDSELSSSVPFPINAFSSDAENRLLDINSWLFSAEFEQIDMKDALTGTFNYDYVPETNIQLNGSVKSDKGYKLKKGTVTAICLDNRMADVAEIDKKGNFTLSLPDFENGNSFFLQAKENKNDDEIYNITIKNDTIPPFGISRTSTVRRLYETQNENYQQSDDAKQLAEITVKAKRRRVKYTAEERYYKNRYIENEDLQKFNVFNLQRMIESFFSIYMYIGTGKYGEYLITRRPSVLNTKMNLVGNLDGNLGDTYSNEIPVILDGNQMHFSDAEIQCTVDDIVYAEYLSPSQTLGELGCRGCINGALVIKTGRKLNPPEKRKGTYYTPLGLTPSSQDSFPLPKEKGEYLKIDDVFLSNGIVHSTISKVLIP